MRACGLCATPVHTKALMAYRLRSTTASAGPATRAQRRGYRFAVATPPEADSTAIAERIRDHQSRHLYLPHTNEHTTRPAPTPTPRTERLAAPQRKVFRMLSPIGHKDGRTRLEGTLITESWLPDWMGEIKLRVNPDAMDVSRIGSGIFSMLAGHDSEKPIGHWLNLEFGNGRLTGTAELATGPMAKECGQEIKDGARRGLSIGFIFTSVRMLRSGDDEYREDRMRVIVDECSVHECSAVTSPRDPNSFITRVY